MPSNLRHRTMKIILLLQKNEVLWSFSVDTVSERQRSWNMSRIHSKDTKPEMIVRSFLHKNGFRFRLHVKNLPGHPDIVLPKYRTVVEVRGCFWHRHPGCRQATTPSTNAEFWQEKFKRNVERDRNTEKLLKELGWNLIVVWECELKNDERLNLLINQIFHQGRNDHG